MSERKRGPLSKSDKFYIDEMYPKLDMAAIANDLGRTLDQIRKYITTQSDKKNDNLMKRQNETKKKSQVEKLMGLEHPDRKKGVVIMNAGASQYNDMKREEEKSAPKKSKYQKNIHIIKP